MATLAAGSAVGGHAAAPQAPSPAAAAGASARVFIWDSVPSAVLGDTVVQVSATQSDPLRQEPAMHVGHHRCTHVIYIMHVWI